MLELPQEDTLSRVQCFAASRGWFITIPYALKKIAIERAVKTIELPEKDLLLVAGEVDAHAIDNPIARFDKEKNGPLLNNNKQLRVHLVKFGYPYDVVERICLKSLRTSIASRLVREDLARALGGQLAVTRREDFKAANDLTWQAVDKLS